jgi:phosphatidylinositol alpha-1,6-mannosyltransferase
VTSGPRVLVVTNDFPPRLGGIETFVRSLCASLDPADLVVYASTAHGCAAADANLPFPVVRDPTPVLLPTPAVGRRVRAVLGEHECDTVVFGASAPLGLLADRLRDAGAVRTVALTHGHEAWWATMPGARRLLRRIGETNDVLTYVSEYSRRRIARALTPDAARRMRPLSPGVDLGRFRPGLDGLRWRRAWGIEPGQPVVLSASRLVRRKGHDVLLEAWAMVAARCRGAVLVIAGDGPMRRSLERRRSRLGIADSVRVVPGIAWQAMPSVYAAADVFVLPCRTRRGGLEPEALGIVFLEAAASGLPIVVGRSGGAPETVVDSRTGLLVDPRDCGDVAAALVRLVGDVGEARAMGSRGRQFVADEYGSQLMDYRFREILEVRERPVA